MINVRNHLIVAIYINGLNVLSVYTQGLKIWPNETELLSCYYNGYWTDEYPWTDETPWTD